MAVIKPQSGNLLLKRSLAVAAALTITFLILHILFVNNARAVFKKYIAEQSHGKIEVELSHLDVNLWSNRLQIHEAELVSMDTLTDPITYHVSFSRVSVKVGSIWELLVHKKLLLDSLKLYNPVIRVIQWRKDTAKVVLKDELSIPQEMGKVYNSLLNALDKFAVRRIIIDNASISLVNKMKPGSEPVTVSKIFFDLNRSAIRNEKNITYLNKEQRIELRTSHQDIALPGGRHHISFKSLRLRLLGESIELDSCTVTAMPTDSVRSNYQIFFKKLLLTGVDFSALSSKNVIKADTVYCENPLFDLNLYRSDAVVKKTEIPDPNKIIRELTGNLNLGFVGVKNAGIHFDIYGKTKRSFFNANKDNFDIKDFRVNPDSLQPVSISSFNMTLRDYHLYNEDSSSMFSFDSLHFLNNRIILNDFAVLSSSSKTRLRNKVEIKIPYFELSELDWYQLIFEQNMVAKEAVLNNPVINFTRTKSGAPGKKLDLFAALLSLDSMVALEKVSVINGQVNGRLGPASSFNVQNIDFNVYSNKLLRSTNKEGLRRSVEHLSFSKGDLRLKDIIVQSEHARYTGDNLIYADKIAISGRGNKITATVHNVLVNNLQLNDIADNIEVDGLTWDSAVVALKAFPYGKNGNSSSIHLRNVAGSNTRLNYSNGPTSVSTYIQTLEASSLFKEGNDPIHVENFIVAGNDLLINSKTVKLNAGSYKISGSDSSTLKDFRMSRIVGVDTLQIRCSNIEFATDLNNMFANDQHLRYVRTTAPVIIFNKWDSLAVTHDSSVVLLPVRIDQVTAVEPDIIISTHRRDSVAIIRIPRSDKSTVLANGIDISDKGLQIDSVVINTNAATFSKSPGQVLGVEKGKVNVELSNVEVDNRAGSIHWGFFINNLSLENANGLQLGKTKNNVRFRQASLGDLHLSSDFFPGFNKLLKANRSAWLHIPGGEFIDSIRTLQWYNVTFINSTRTLTLDSFVYHPTKTLDSVLAIAPYQLDYITIKTGAVSVDGLDVEQYEKDNSFIANTIKINKPVLTVYRDKKPPHSPFKKTSLFPVNMIRNIVPPVSVRSIQCNDGTITYSEKNGTSRKQGDLLLTHVGGILGNIKNNNYLDNDSLSLTFKASLMDSARINLKLKQSFIDSSGGFRLNAEVTPADLSILNTFLIPTLNLKVISGMVDSVSLHAVGRQDRALGEMNMHYRKLRIRFVKNGLPGKSTVFQHVSGFFANTFIVKNNNATRPGVIYSTHAATQSFVNYIVRISLSGIMSSIGIRSNHKLMQQYKRGLKDSNRPEIKL